MHLTRLRQALRATRAQPSAASFSDCYFNAINDCFSRDPGSELLVGLLPDECRRCPFACPHV